MSTATATTRLARDVAVENFAEAIAASHGVPVSRRCELPAAPGLYLVYGGGGQVLYIGAAHNLRKRWQAHHRLAQAQAAEAVVTWLTMSVSDAFGDEEAVINTMRPKWNGRCVPRPTRPEPDHKFMEFVAALIGGSFDEDISTASSSGGDDIELCRLPESKIFGKAM